MQRSWVVVVACLAVAVSCGCDSQSVSTIFGKSWGELGEETSAGPYRFRPPESFTLDKTARGAPGETKIMFRGPVFGKSEPGIVLSCTAHGGALPEGGPNWTEAARMGLMGLRANCRDFTSNTGAPTSVNGIPAVRVDFGGDLTVKNQTRAMRGVGYLMIDDTYLLFALAMDFGPNAASSIPKLENSLKTISRPGYAGSPNPWSNSGRVASPANTPGMGVVPGTPSFGGGRAGAPDFPGASPGAGFGGPRGRGPMSGNLRGSGVPLTGFPNSVGRPTATEAHTIGSGTSRRPSVVKPLDPEEVKRRAEMAAQKNMIIAAACDSADPGYHRANMELLKIGDESEKQQALERIAAVAPGDVGDAELRKEIARALRDVAEDVTLEDRVRREAIPVLVAWVSTYSAPILIGLLDDDSPGIRLDALRELTPMKDERAIEPVTEIFVNDASLRAEAAECLRSFGSLAEDKVLELARPTDFMITQATVQLLGDIGTDKSLEAFRLLRKMSVFRLVKKDVNEATAKIRQRATEVDPT